MVCACGFFQDYGSEGIEVCGGDAVRFVGVDGVFGGDGGDLFAGAEVEAEVEAGVEGGVARRCLRVRLCGSGSVTSK